MASTVLGDSRARASGYRAAHRRKNPFRAVPSTELNIVQWCRAGRFAHPKVH